MRNFGDVVNQIEKMVIVIDPEKERKLMEFIREESLWAPYQEVCDLIEEFLEDLEEYLSPLCAGVGETTNSVTD